MSNVKEVQTDHSALMEYFEQLEKKKRLFIGQSLAAKLIPMNSNSHLITKAMKHNPIFLDVHRPIATFMKQVLTGKSEAIVRSHKKTLKIIKEILQQRVDLLKEPEKPENFQNLDQFFWHWLTQNFGDRELCHKYCESFMQSFVYWAESDSRVDMFRRFVGLNMTGRWPFSVFRFYLDMLRATNISLNTLFSMDTDLNE